MLRVASTAADALAWEPPPERVVRIVDVRGRALVLGSTQPAPLGARVEEAGVEVLRRRSGGGAVLLEPGAQVWADVVVRADDPLHDDDVGRAFHWLGHAWREALAGLGVEVTVHEGPLERTRWSPLVCFAALGPGEVAVGGRKVVGISQRRTRHWSLFQCACLLRWNPARICDLLGIDGPGERADIAAAATGVDLGAGVVSAAFLSALAGA